MGAARAGHPGSDVATIPPAWIATPTELERLARRLTAAPEIALDTEGDSLHHYPERLALVQIALPTGEAWLVDPLALADLSPLAPVFADGRTILVLHAGDNDLAHLKRRYAFAFRAIFDTSIAARFLGARALGLDVLLAEYLGVELPPSRQKDDWSVRPLSPAQLQYAVADVLHLFDLKSRLSDELKRAERSEWVEEECAALAAQPVSERPPDPDAYARLKGVRDLSPRGLAILRELYELRERLALGADRPPFKILAEETLVRLALAAPADRAALAQVSGCTPRVIARWGEAILDAVARGGRAEARALPAIERTRRPGPPAIVKRRIEALRVWRSEAVGRVGLEPGAFLPNRLIRLVAEAGPSTRDELAGVDGIRRWRVEAFGAEILAALARA